VVVDEALGLDCEASGVVLSMDLLLLFVADVWS
jgi:hypothetical protein